jgi:hypothetical protein
MIFCGMLDHAFRARRGMVVAMPVLSGLHHQYDRI